MQYLQILQTLLVAIVGGGIWGVLQTLISGRQLRGKTEGEAHQAAGAGSKSEADAEAVDSEARIREWNEHIRLARDAQHAAEKARDESRAMTLNVLAAFEATLDGVERVLDLRTDDSAAVKDALRDLQVMLRAGRRTVWELRP